MKYWIVLLVALSVGCAWVGPVVVPSNTFDDTMQLKVGVVPATDVSMQLYGPKIVEVWKQDRLFNQVTLLTRESFLYRDPKKLDYIIELGIQGTWVVNKINILEALFIDLTLGLGGTVVGNELSGTNILNAVVVDTKTGNEVASYSIESRTTVDYGIMADPNVVTATADNIQSRKLAILLAERIRVDFGERR
jgi:hypothetical protein